MPHDSKSYRWKLSPAGKAAKKRYKTKKRAEWKLAGLCLRCGSADRGTKSLCRKHQEKQRLARERRAASRPPRVLLTPEEKKRRRAITKRKCALKSRQRWRKCGMCPRCGGTPQEGRLQCRKCSTRADKAKSRALRIGRQSAGLCIDCGHQATEGKRTCGPCRDKDREDRRIANAKIAAAGLCQRCRTNKATVGVFCEECWYRGRAQGTMGSSARWQEIKALLIAQNYRCAYSGKVLILGGDATIDHKIPS